MEEIYLTFPSNLSVATGYEYGECIYNTQINPKLENIEKFHTIVIIFPKQINRVSILFVKGLMNHLLKKYDKYTLNKFLKFKSLNEEYGKDVERKLQISLIF